jgi:hypothetical protein
MKMMNMNIKIRNKKIDLVSEINLLIQELDGIKIIDRNKTSLIMITLIELMKSKNKIKNISKTSRD